MITKTRTLRAAFAGVAFVGVAVAAMAEISDEAAEVIERSIEAAGGKERLEKIHAIKMVGTMSMPAMGMEMKMTSIQVHPDKGYFEQDIPGMGTMVQAYDGDSGWAQNPMQGFHRMSPEEVQAQKQNRTLRDMIDYRETFETAERLEDQGDLAVVKVTLAESGQEETHYFSKSTGHAEKIEMVADMGPQGAVPATMTITEMVEQDGLVFPKRMNMNAAGMEIQMSFDEIEVNPEIDESLFAPPQ